MTRYPLYWRLHGPPRPVWTGVRKKHPYLDLISGSKILGCARPAECIPACLATIYNINIICFHYWLYRHLVSTCTLTIHITYMVRQTSRVIFSTKCYIATCPIINHYITTSILMSRVWCDAVRLQLITGSTDRAQANDKFSEGYKLSFEMRKYVHKKWRMPTVNTVNKTENWPSLIQSNLNFFFSSGHTTT